MVEALAEEGMASQEQFKYILDDRPHDIGGLHSRKEGPCKNQEEALQRVPGKHSLALWGRPSLKERELYTEGGTPGPSYFPMPATKPMFGRKGGEATSRQVLSPLIAALRKDEAFFLQHRDEFLQDHRGEFVAIRDGAVLGFAKTATDVAQMVDGILGPCKRALVKKVEPHAFEETPEVMGF
ncbi:MAG: hypothetical protein ACLFTT_04215 [Candidatus Hydrogenedentota bacterium]